MKTTALRPKPLGLEGAVRMLLWAWLATAGACLLSVASASAQGGDGWVDYGDDYGYGDDYAAEYYDEAGYPALTTRIWLDRGDDPVLDRGDRARLYYRTSEDAFVAIFHIDTNGTTRLVFPRSPDEDNYVRGGRDFRLVFPGSSYWVVSDDPGVGYFFAVASFEPLDFRDFGYAHYAGGWDLSSAGRRVYRDPYVAMDDFVERLIPDWEYVEYALDFSSYHVEERYEYPRFLCYDCHGFRPYASWNPYLASCTSFRVVVYDDPYYYPATRYRGAQVVFARPVRPGLPRFDFKERARGEAVAPLVIRRAPANSSAGPRPRVVEPAERSRWAVPRPGAPSASPARVPTRTRPSQALPSRGGTPSTGSRTRPTLERRAPSRTSPGSTTRVPTTRVVPPRSSGGGGGAPARATPARPPATGSGGGGAQARAAPTRSSGGGAATRSAPTRAPTTRPGGGGAPARAAPTRSSGGGAATRSAPTRAPTTRPGGGGAPARAAPTRSSGGGAATRSAPTRAPTTRPGGGGSPARAAPTRSSGGGAATRSAPTRAPTTRPGGGGSPARAAPTRSSGGGAATRSAPTTRPGGGGSPARAAPTRSSGGGAATRSAPTRAPATRPGGGGAPARATPTRSGGGGAATRSAPTRAPKPRPGGGGVAPATD